MRQLIAVVALTFALTSCGASKHTPGGPYYFKSFEGLETPIRPIGEISPADAESLQKEGYAFCMTWFDSTGQIERFEKHYRGAVTWHMQYLYREGRLIKATGADQDGKEINRSYASPN